MEPSKKSALEELKKTRQDWVESNRKNDFDFKNILADLYSDPTHFIFEIIQNAEDAEASQITFTLHNDSLKITHNGKNFDHEDVEGITKIGKSRKKSELNTVGKFGIGFKSVFAITKSPIITSGEYAFKISDFVVPEEMKNETSDYTNIKLPFNNEEKSREECYRLIADKLANVGLKTLLFLKNISEIRWETEEGRGHYLKSKTVWKDNPIKCNTVQIISENEDVEYLVFEKPINIEANELKVEVAFKLSTDENGSKEITSENESKLFATFPTEKETHLNFIIQGPYKTTPNRENIPFEDSDNQNILDKTVELVQDSLDILKDQGFLNVKLLTLLPIKGNLGVNEVYSKFYEGIKNALHQKELLPTSNNDFVSPNESLLARSSELVNLLRSNDLQLLFSKRYWLSPKITYDRTRELRDYLINELDVKEIDFQSLARAIKPDFLKAKSDDWLSKFYDQLVNQASLWRKGSKDAILLRRPIIRTLENEHVEPFKENGDLNVYLPSNNQNSSNYRIVKPDTIKSEEAENFLKGLGLKEPDFLAFIKEGILPKYNQEQPIKEFSEYYYDISFLLEAFNELDSSQLNHLVPELRETPIVKNQANKNKTDNTLKRPVDLYLPSTNLIDYISDLSRNFVSKSLYEEFDEEELNQVLLKIGVHDKPSKIQLKSDSLTDDEKSELRKQTNLPRQTREKVYDYNLDGLDSFFESISFNKSIALWEILGNAKDAYFRGLYKWWSHNSNPREKRFYASFVKKLRNQPWLYTKEGELAAPKDITKNELSQHYYHFQNLLTILQFKPDQFQEVEKEGYIPVPKNEYEEFKKWKESQINENDNESNGSDDSVEFEYNPEETNPSNVEFSHSEVNFENEKKEEVSKTPHYEEYEYEITKPVNISHKKSSNSESSANPAENKAIGDWAEKLVERSLKKEFEEESEVEVINLNRKGSPERGCDIKVQKGEEIIKLVEVKGTELEKDSLHISGNQWEYARHFYSMNDGNKYWIYCVFSVGDNNPKIIRIQNPIKKWKEGNLFADPVQFIISKNNSR